MMKKSLFFALSLFVMQSVFATDCITSCFSAQSLQLTYQRPMMHSPQPLCVYNVAQGEGFVVKVADRVIGYSQQGSFSPETAAPAMLEWLDAVAQCGVASLSESEAESLHFSPVQPLLGTIAWNQDAPYNDLCPRYDLSTVSATGCVATAMAQLMYYHRWPEQGAGQHSYAPAVLMGNVLSADFGATRYAWSDMLPVYTAQSSPESRHAVAELMLHCGISVDMEYFSASGALDTDVPPALSTYFGYSHSMAYRKREHYGTADWLAVIHDELQAGRPVLAYGRATSGGHAYVFDGMDEQGLIHVNWGWGGLCNGYFQASALTPATQGIGGSDGGFNYRQRIITGIQPLHDAQDGPYAVELTSSEGLSASPKRIQNGQEVTLRLAGKVCNHGWRTSTFDYGVQLLSADGQTSVIYEGPQSITLDVEQETYAPTFGQISFGLLPEGDYVLYPVCRDSGSEGPWQRIRDVYIGYPNLLRMQVASGVVTFQQPDYFSLQATDLQLPETFYSGVPAQVCAEISNNGDVEYHGEVRLALYSGTSRVGVSTNHIIDLLPGQHTTIQFTEAYALTPGTYQLTLIDDDGQSLCARQSVTFQSASALGTPVSSQLLVIEAGQDGQLTATAHMQVTEGLFGGLLYTYIYEEQGSVLRSCLEPTYFMVHAGDEIAVQMSGIFEQAQPGATYLARLVVFDGYSSTLLSDANASVFFSFGAGDEALTQLPADAPSSDGPCYDLFGRPARRGSRTPLITPSRTIIIY